jgi:phosphomannomutase
MCRYKRGYKNVINKGIELNNEGTECELMMETSGHGALRENRFLDDGAYMSVKLTIEAARRKWEGRSGIRWVHLHSPQLCAFSHTRSCPEACRLCTVPVQGPSMCSQLLDELEEPKDAVEVRLSITDEEFKQTANEVIEAFEDWVASSEWQVDEPNFEGVRVKVPDNDGAQTGWLLLRASLHDPLLVVNAESDEEGGVLLSHTSPVSLTKKGIHSTCCISPKSSSICRRETNFKQAKKFL